MTTAENLEYTVDAMRRFFTEERQRAADNRDQKRYDWMDRNIMTLDILVSDYWALSGHAWRGWAQKDSK
jgi:hypothetical protein